MSLTLKYSDPRGIDEPAALVSLGSNVRYGQFSVTMSAELGQAAMSTLEIEDPGGYYNLVGLRAFDSRETSAPSNNSVIGRFVMQDRVIGRSKERALLTGAARLWSVDLTDYNWHISSRIHTDVDAKRPAETAGDRIRWLLTRAAHINLHDYGHVEYPTTQMDAADYRGQRAGDLLADCAVESGSNFWCDFNEAHGTPELFFLDPNGTSYESSIVVSNVIGDVDSVVTFFPSMDGEVRRSVSRLAYGVYLAYANGSVYVRNDTVGEQFGTIDQTAPMSNVKTRDRALRVANKFLADNDEEDDRVTFEIIVPRAQVNDVRHGQRMVARFQHIPNYENRLWVRVVKKSVIQDEDLGDDYYRLAIEAVPCGVWTAPDPCQAFGPTPAGFYPPNEDQTSDATGNVIYWKAGSAVPHVPTPFYNGSWFFFAGNNADGSVPGGIVDYPCGDSTNTARLLVVGAGTMTVYLRDQGYNNRRMSWTMYGVEADLVTETGLDTGDFDVPADLVVVVPDDGYCYHIVDIGLAQAYAQPPQNWVGFGGFTWVRP